MDTSGNTKMSIKQKAKAYDEALEKARAMYGGIPTDNAILKEIFPELAESDDERIRKQLIDAIKIGRSNSGISFTEEAASRYIAWLEKQKEQKVDIDKLRRDLYQSGYNDGYQHGKEDAQKEPHYTKRNALFDKCVENCDPAVMKKVSDEVDEMLEKEQKPEWSEEDEDMLNSCISSIEEAKENRYYYRETDGDTSYDHEISWLKSLRPQPKKNDMITPNKEFFQWIYNRLVDVHNENPNVDYMISFKKRIEEMSFDKSHWRPSEEQMGAVKHAYSSFPNDSSTKSNLKLLYHDLEKLM